MLPKVWSPFEILSYTPFHPLSLICVSNECLAFFSFQALAFFWFLYRIHWRWSWERRRKYTLLLFCIQKETDFDFLCEHVLPSLESSLAQLIRYSIRAASRSWCYFPLCSLFSRLLLHWTESLERIKWLFSFDFNDKRKDWSKDSLLFSLLFSLLPSLRSFHLKLFCLSHSYISFFYFMKTTSHWDQSDWFPCPSSVTKGNISLVFFSFHHHYDLPLLDQEDVRCIEKFRTRRWCQRHDSRCIFYCISGYVWIQGWFCFATFFFLLIMSLSVKSLLLTPFSCPLFSPSVEWLSYFLSSCFPHKH